MIRTRLKRRRPAAEFRRQAVGEHKASQRAGQGPQKITFFI